MTLYLPIAPPGSGKSYTAQLMVEKGMIPSTAVVSSDHYREVLADNRQDMTATNMAFKIADMIIEERITRGLDVYMDGTNLNPKFRNKLLNKLQSTYRYHHNLGGKLPIVILVPDEPKWLVEERNRNRRWPVPDEVFERFWSQFENLDVDPYVQLYEAKVMTFRQMEDMLEEQND